jgi:anti-anti-sigma regulatory factor
LSFLGEAAADMLKVTIKEQPESFTLVLEGRLCRPWTSEAERGWSTLILAAADKELLLDLAGVTFVDRDGEALLTSILEHGAKVRASGVLVSHMVRQVQQRISSRPARSSRGTPRSRRGPSVL